MRWWMRWIDEERDSYGCKQGFHFELGLTFFSLLNTHFLRCREIVPQR